MNVLDEVEQAIRKYCILPSDEAYTAVTLWAAATWAATEWETATRLVIKAPEKRCGKSRLLDILECLVSRPEMAGNASTAAIVDTIAGVSEDDDEAALPTVLIDEYDQWLPKGGPLVGMLNMGHQRGRPYTRMEQGRRKKVNTYAWVALAGIGSAPDTIEDRAICIHMRRRLPEETVAPFRRRRDQEPLMALGRKLGAAVAEGMETYAKAEPGNPLEDRAADNWEPTLTMADWFTPAGKANNPHSWAVRARRAAIVLTAEAEALREASAGVKLLEDIRAVFASKNVTRISTTDLLLSLAKRDVDTWGDLDDRTMSRMLRSYSIRPKMMQFKTPAGREGARGYERAMFADAWKRYLVEGSEDTPVKLAG